MKFTRSTFLFVAGLSIIVIAILLSGGFIKSAASIQTTSEPASEGRAITPAGALVLDMTTRMPAVGSLTVDFVRSPDDFGNGRKGRYLIAVNSGFGVQFNSATNRAQQSLAVIDLNAK